MNVIAIEGSYQSSNGDMGESHIQIHNKQHNFLQDGEPLVEEITDTKLTDSGINLAISKAQELGIKTPDEWKVANAKERHKNRRTKTYMEYVAKLGKNIVTNKKAKLFDDENTSPETRQKIRRELSYIEQNQGIPIYSTLYYVGSVDDYDGKTAEQVKLIRQAKAETLRTYLSSNQFKELHPGLTRMELHYDEKGDIHGQGQEVFVNKRKNGYADFAQRAVIKKALIKRYGRGDDKKGQQELNRRLDLLIHAHREVAGHKNIGDERADYKYLKWALTGSTPNKMDITKHTARERNTRLVELARIEDMFWLNKTAEKVFAKHGLSWNFAPKYVTDGKHRTAPEYTESLKLKQKSRHQRKAIKQQQNQLDKLQEDNKKAQQTLREAYKVVTGEYSQEDVSPLDVAQTVSRASQNVQKQQDDVDQQLAEIRQKAQDAKFNSFVQHQLILRLEQRQKDRLRKLRQREKELNQRESNIKQQENELVTTVTERVLEAIKKPLQLVLDDVKLSIRGNLDAFAKRLLSAETARSKVEHNSKYNHRRFNNFVTNIHNENVIGGIVKNAVNAEVKNQQSDKKQENQKDDGLTM